MMGLENKGGAISISRKTCKGGTLCITFAGRRPGNFLDLEARNVSGNVDFQCKNEISDSNFPKFSACGGHTPIKYNFYCVFISYPLHFSNFEMKNSKTIF